MKGCWLLYSSGKVKLLVRQGMTTPLTEWSKSGASTPPSAEEDGESQDPSFTAGESTLHSLFGRQFDSFLQKQTYT